MPIVSKVSMKYDIGYKFTTFPVGPLQTQSFPIFQSSRTRNWVRQFPGRKAMMVSLLQNGFVPTTSYTDDLQDVVHSKVVTVSGRLNSAPNSIYFYSYVPVYNRTVVSTADSQLLALVANVQSQLQSRISGHGTSVPVSISEAKKTAGMIGDAVSKLALAYRHVRHFKFKAAATALGLEKTPARVGRFKTPDENWLEYRYGWRLVVYDINSLMKTMYDVLSTRPPLLRVTATAKSQSYSTRSLGRVYVNLPNGTQAGSWSASETVEMNREVTGGYVFELESVAIANLTSFGLNNPFLWAWEMIPWSFVLDWIVNVGDILQGLTAFAGKTWRDGWLCKVIESKSKRFWTSPLKASGVYSFIGPDVVTFGPQCERRFARAPMVFTPSSIRVSLDLNTSRAIDAIALLGQIIRK